MVTKETKGAFKSVGVIGGLTVIVPMVDSLLVSAGAISEPLFQPIVADLITAFGAFLSIWGRITATRKIAGLF